MTTTTTTTTITVKTELECNVQVLYGRILALQKSSPKSSRQRILIALAGVPGSGKSTISAALMKELQLRRVGNVALVPMDGFHFPRSVLSSSDNPELAFRRRGAPWTFDVEAFIQLVKDLKSPVTGIDERDTPIYVPSFDHVIQDPVPDDICISSIARIVILEGNYLLLDEPPWKEIAGLVDERWFVDVTNEVAKHRLIQRHLHAGIESTREDAAARIEENDLRNGRLIRAKLIKPDVKIDN